jgi:hypothetical protein
MNIIEKYSINIVNKHRPTGSQVDINEYNEGAAKSLLRTFNKYYEALSYMFSLMEKAHLENTQTYLDMKDKLNKLSI